MDSFQACFCRKPELQVADETCVALSCRTGVFRKLMLVGEHTMLLSIRISTLWVSPKGLCRAEFACVNGVFQLLGKSSR